MAPPSCISKASTTPFWGAISRLDYGPVPDDKVNLDDFKPSVGGQNGYSNKPPTPCGSLVSPLPTAPGTKRLEETLSLSMYWKGLRATVNHRQKVSQLPGEQAQADKIWETASKTCHHQPWEALCVDLIGPYTLKGKDKTQIDFIMRHNDRSCNKLVRNCRGCRYHSSKLDIPTGTKGHKGKDTACPRTTTLL
eukprot:CCRYP_011324-RA/>CCRYP_011324-RA protein AED:0.45 eAED:1.00 QI:0/0/0/1/0/0/2/0/192